MRRFFVAWRFSKMATNWNAILANINNASDILAILRKVLSLLDGKVDLTKIDEIINDITSMQTDVDTALTNVTSALSEFDTDAQEAIEQVIAAGLMEGFTTEAELLASRPTVLKKYAKAEDTDVIWFWNKPEGSPDGSYWVNTGLSELTQAKDYTDLRERLGLSRNIFTLDEIKGIDFSRITNLTGRTSVSRIAPKSIKVTGAANTTTEVRWRFSAAHFKETNAISASIRLKSASASLGAATQAVRFTLWQVRADFTSFKSDFSVITGPNAVTTEKNVILENITLDASAVYVEIGFSIQSVAARDLVFENFCISSASKAVFIRPRDNPKNLFPDPLYSGQYSTAFQGLARTENNELIMTFDESAATLQSLYSIPAVNQFAPGAIVRFGSEIFSTATNATHMTMFFYDAAGASILSSNQSSRIANIYDILSSEFEIPANCVRIDLRLMKDLNATIAKFKPAFLYSSFQDRGPFNPQFPLTIIFVDAVKGSDTNNGTQTAPVKTLARAMLMAGYNTQIIVAEGDYYEAPQVSSKIGILTVVAARNSRVRLIGGRKLTGFTKTNGYTKVWQVPLATNPVTDGTDRCGYWLYQLGVSDASTEILRRWPQQMGRTNRLSDCTQIWRAYSIAEIESATKPSWFWDAGVLYLSCVGFGDPNLVEIRVPDTLVSPFYTSNTTKNQTITLVGLESYFWLSGFRVWDFARVELERLKAIGNRVNGFEISDNIFIRQVACEGYGNWVDGNGGHVYRENVTKQSCRYEGEDNYFHDNGDDGFSYHEMWAGYTSGMLCEYNGDRGIADAVGSHMSHYNPIVYKNGQGDGKWPIDDGAGISCVGTSTDGGVSTDTRVSGGFAEGNLINYNVGGSNENVMNLFDCKSHHPVKHHFSATNGKMNLFDCGYRGMGTGEIKNQTNGVINILNTEKVT
ncbi:DUF1565 domain-containing protein [Acinetobacter oleivorans]|uniref:DUF1565 domain-containing protein n=1 Tax=Acinetobacter oleivorans TaxID=1148157 RepID=UPI003A850E2D